MVKSFFIIHGCLLFSVMVLAQEQSKDQVKQGSVVLDSSVTVSSVTVDTTITVKTLESKGNEALKKADAQSAAKKAILEAGTLDPKLPALSFISYDIKLKYFEPKKYEVQPISLHGISFPGEAKSTEEKKLSPVEIAAGKKDTTASDTVDVSSKAPQPDTSLAKSGLTDSASAVSTQANQLAKAKASDTTATLPKTDLAQDTLKKAESAVQSPLQDTSKTTANLQQDTTLTPETLGLLQEKAKQTLTPKFVQWSVKKDFKLFRPSRYSVKPIELKGLDSIKVESADTTLDVSGVFSQLIEDQKEEIDSGKAALDSSFLNLQKDPTDKRINPIKFNREVQTVPNEIAFQMESIYDDKLGCRYFIPVNWKTYSYRKNNLIGFFVKNDISVIISVGYAIYEDLSVWAHLQEALFFGHNFIKKDEQLASEFLLKKMVVNQAFYGRYSFQDMQYNTAYFRYKEYQFHIIVRHPYGVLSAKDAIFINFLLSNFLGGQPNVNVPRYVKLDPSQSSVSSDQTAGAKVKNESKVVKQNDKEKTKKKKRTRKRRRRKTK